MIQVYSPYNTDYEKNGDMPLLPSSAEIHVILNGAWTAELIHPIDEEGRWKYIVENAVVKMPSFNGEQLFRIGNVEKKESGVSADLTPVFFDAKKDCFLMDVRPTNKNGQDALDIMMASNKKYTGKSDIPTISTAYYQTKNLIEAISGSDDNSFLSRWGGEIIYDNYTVYIDRQAGNDHGVQVMYGKNIAQDGFSEKIDTSSVITRIVPKAYNGYMMSGTEQWVDSPLISKYPNISYGVMTFEDVKMAADASDDDVANGVTVCNSQEELDAALKKKCMERYDDGLDKPKVTISASMELLQDTDLYKDLKALEAVSLGDTVHCKHRVLEIITDTRAVELKWDPIKDKLTEVTLGDAEYNFLSEYASTVNRVEEAIRADGTVKGQQVQGIINGVKAQLKAMSTIAEKQSVRAVLFEDLDPSSPTYGAMCLGTMGFQIASRRTSDGKDWNWTTFGTGAGFYADCIVAGTMLADRIKGGTLILGGKDNGNGVAKILDADGKEVLVLDKNGAYAKGRYISISKDGTKRTTVNRGQISVAGEDGTTSGIVSYLNNGITMQAYGGSGTSHVVCKRDGTLDLWASGKAAITCNSVQVNGNTGKSGRAEFSDGSYIDFRNGICIGGNSKEGGAF